MDQRLLGNTGLRVSALGLGTVKIGRDTGVKYPKSFQLPDDAAVRDLLRLAADLGINLLDTAPAYGTSEERLGPLLPAPRDRWVISTKVGESYDHGVSTFDFSASHTKKSIERSLRRLRTDRIDLVLLHSDGVEETEARFGEALEALDDLKQAGVIRATGISPKSEAGARLAIARCDAVMLTLNPVEREAAPLVEEARAAGVGVLIKKGLASGHLHPPPESRDNRGGAGEAGGAPSHATNDPVESAMRFIFGHRGVSSLVVGTINPAHLRANVNACRRAADERRDDAEHDEPGESADQRR